MITFLLLLGMFILIAAREIIALFLRLLGFNCPSFFSGEPRPLTKDEKDYFYAQEMEKRRQKREENKSRRR